jgi:uncharacterized protein (DUF302 family)
MLTTIIISFLSGALITIMILFFSAPSMMLREDKSKHDFQRTTEEIEKSVEAAGWKIPHINDLQATLHKFGKDVRQVKVYEICQPDLAYEILSRDNERIAASLMPCRIAVYERSDGSVFVSRLNAKLMSRPMNKIIRKNMALAARETEMILEPVID